MTYYSPSGHSLLERLLVNASPTGPQILLLAFVLMGWTVFLALRRRPLPILFAHGFSSLLPVLLGVYGTASMAARAMNMVSSHSLDADLIQALPDTLIPLSIGALVSCVNAFASVLLLLFRALPSGSLNDKPVLI